jgi:hypothetical protein
MDVDRLLFDEPDTDATIIQDAAKETVKYANFTKLIEKITSTSSSTFLQPYFGLLAP